MNGFTQRRWLSIILLLPFAALGCSGCGHQAASPPSLVPAAPRNTPIVRIKLISNAAQVRITSTAPLLMHRDGGPPQSVEGPASIALSEAGWQAGGMTIAAGELSVEPSPGALLDLDGARYRGTLRLVPTSSATFDVVNHVDVDSYLKGVVAKELLKEFQPQAYVAQAITARTYALYEWRAAPKERAFDLYADTRSQVYGGVAAETAKSVSAVDGTVGQVVAYGPPGEERIFKAYFSSCCGGAGQSAAQAFGDADAPPLREHAVGGLCSISPRFNWGPVIISRQELTRRFRLFGQTHGKPLKQMATLAQITIAKLNGVGRPIQFAVTDVRGTRFVLSGEELRTAVNTDAHEPASRTAVTGQSSPARVTTLPSGYVEPVTDGSSIRFQNGHGFGHGVGLCQWCAEAQARQGLSGQQIVEAAFPGGRVVQGY